MRLFFLLFTVSVTTFGYCQGLDCSLDFNGTELKHLPRSARCRCDPDEDLETFSPLTDLAAQIDFDLISALHSLLFIECEQLHLNLSISDDVIVQQQPFPLQEIHVSDTQTVSLSAKNSHKSVNRVVIERAEKTSIEFESEQTDNGEGDQEEDIWLIPENNDLYFFLVLILSGLLILSWITLMAVSICLCRARRGRGGGCCYCCSDDDDDSSVVGRKRGKRVSRAESWRYESNILINPSRMQQQQRQQQRTQSPVISSPLQPMLPYQQGFQERQQEERPQSSALREAFEFGRGGFHDSTSGTRKTGDNNNSPPILFPDIDDDDDDGYADTGRRLLREEDCDASNANSASYNSRNQATTLPLNKL